MGIFERFRGKPHEESAEKEPDPITLKTQQVCGLLELTSPYLRDVIERDFMENAATQEEKYENLSDRGYDPKNMLAEGKKKADDLKSYTDNYNPGHGIRNMKYLKFSPQYTELRDKVSPEELYLHLELADKISTQAYQVVKAAQADLGPQEAQALANDNRFLLLDGNEGRKAVQQFVKGINDNPDLIKGRMKNFIRSIANTNRQKQYRSVAVMLYKESKISTD